MESNESDFNVDTKEHCFFCFNQINSISKNSKPVQEEQRFPISIQNLSRYLKLDMRKVFQGPVPPHLLKKVERSRLKVELCLDCSKITDKLTKLFEQLERIEMEITFRLNTISSKITYSEENGKMENIKLDNQNESEDLQRKLEIAQVLREEINYKCLIQLKASDSFPKVQIKKTKWKKDFDNKNGSETSEVNPIIDQIKIENCSYPDPAIETTDTDVEFGAPENDHWHSSPSSAVSNSTETVTVTVKKETVTSRKWKSESTNSSDSNIRKGKTMLIIQDKNKTFTSAVPPPIKLAATDKPMPILDKSIINPKNGKHKCRVCSKEYAIRQSFALHFKSVHMKISYNCPVPDCRKNFRLKHHYEIHYRNVHLKIRYRCKICKKTFAQKSNLTKHVKGAHR